MQALAVCLPHLRHHRMACCRKRSQFKSSLLPAPIAVSQVYTRAKILRKSIVDCLGEMTFSFEADSSEVIFPFIGSPFFVPFIYRTGSALFCCMFLQKKNCEARCRSGIPATGREYLRCASVFRERGVRQNVSSILFSSAILRILSMAYRMRPNAVFMLTLVASAISLKLMLR